jgi:hypothetical protein
MIVNPKIRKSRNSYQGTNRKFGVLALPFAGVKTCFIIKIISFKMMFFVVVVFRLDAVIFLQIAKKQSFKRPQ